MASTTINLEEGLAIGEVFGMIAFYFSIRNFEEGVILGEDFFESHTIRTINSLEDVFAPSDDILVEILVQPRASLAEVIGLVDALTHVGTRRNERNLLETINLIDTFTQGFGIKVADGTIDGLSFKSFQANDSGALLAVPPFNWIFIRWMWIVRHKEGIQNIYRPSTTLVVPSGGGEIAAKFFDPGAIGPKIKSLVIILEPFDFEYIEDLDGDYILTKETITIVGDSMGVAKTNLTIEQGAAFSRIVIYRGSDGDPVDLTGYTAKMHIRKTKGSSVVLLELSTTNGRLVLGGALGTVKIGLTTVDTDALDFVWGRYDLELYKDGDISQAVRLLEGKIGLSKQVTRQ